MRLCLLGLMCIVHLHVFAQEFSLGAMAGGHFSSFTSSNPLQGWKVAGVFNYELGRFTLAEQIGVTMDRSKSSLPHVPARQNRWQYLWVDATTFVSWLPIRKQAFDAGFGSGVSIRRIIPGSIEGNPYGTGNISASRMHDWTFFLPARLQMNLHLKRDRDLVCALEYQIQIRSMYENGSNNNAFDFAPVVNKLYSIGLSAAYMFPL